MSVRSAGRNDEEIGGVVQSPKVEHHELAALQIMNGVQRQAERLRIRGVTAAVPHAAIIPSRPRRAGRGAVLDLIEDAPGAGTHMGPEHPGRQGHEAVPRPVGRHQRRPDPLGGLRRVGMDDPESDHRGRG